MLTVTYCPSVPAAEADNPGAALRNTGHRLYLTVVILLAS